MIVAISKAKRQGKDQHGSNDKFESGACFLEAMKSQAEAMMGGPIILDAISLRNVEQPFFDHGDHEVLRVRIRSSGSIRLACVVACQSSIANACLRCTAMEMAEHSPAPKRPSADNDRKRDISSGVVMLVCETTPASMAMKNRLFCS